MKEILQRQEVRLGKNKYNRKDKEDREIQAYRIFRIGIKVIKADRLAERNIVESASDSCSL
jgi:hypothetical protein